MPAFPPLRRMVVLLVMVAGLETWWAEEEKVWVESLAEED